MIKGRGVPISLLVLVLILRPHMAGDAYPFAQGLVLIPALVGLALLLLSPARVHNIAPTERITLLLPWALFSWSLVTLLWAPDPGQGLRESISLLGGITVFSMAFLILREEARFRTGSFRILSFVVLPVLASALYQRMFGLERIRETLRDMASAGENVTDLALIITDNRVFAGFLNPNMLAGFLAIGICLSLDLFLTASNRREVVLFSLLTGAQCGVLVLTGSMGGSLVAVTMAGAVLLVRRKFSLRDLVLTGTVITAIGAGLLAIRGTGFLLGPESSMVQRIGYMEAGIRMAMVHGVAGWGAGSAPGALMGFVGEGVRPVADPHNFLVRSWVSWGIPGLMILVTFLFIWATAGVRYLSAGRWRNAPAGYAGFFFGSAAFLGHSMLDMDFFIPETALFGWCAMGAAFGLAAAPGESENTSSPEPRNVMAIFSGAAILALVLPTFVFYQGESLAFRAGRAAAEGDYVTAAGLYRDAGSMIPFNGRFALDEGRIRGAAGDRARADELFRKADRLMRASPYPAWEMGRAAQAAGNWQSSIPLLEQALERYRTSPRIRIDLAQAYLKKGQVSRALELLREARSIGVFDPQAQQLADDILSGFDR